MKKYLICLVFAFCIGGQAFAGAEISGSLSTSVSDNNFEIVIPCNPATVNHGTVDSKTCAITCDAGYVLQHNNTCKYRQNSSGSSIGSGSSGPSGPSGSNNKPITHTSTFSTIKFPNTQTGTIVPARKPLRKFVPKKPVYALNEHTSNIGRFPDISQSFAKFWIMEFVDKGYITGYNDGMFYPEKSITRAEYLALLMKVLEIQPNNTQYITFIDIPVGGKWMIPYVETAKELELIQGKWKHESRIFRPNDPISRAEAMVILLRAIQVEVATEFTDLPFEQGTEFWMVSYIKKAKELGIINGQIINGELKFRPNDGMSRAEAIKVLKLASVLQEKKLE